MTKLSVMHALLIIIYDYMFACLFVVDFCIC